MQMFNKILQKLSGLFKQGIEISYSRINTFRTCAWKYKLMYEDGVRIPPNPFIALGLSIHRALDDFHRRAAQSLDELLESYNRSWVNEGFISPQQTQEFYERGQGMLENYWKSSAGRTSEIIYLEKEFRLPLGRHTLRGTIDRVDKHADGTFEIIDYKTHLELWKQEKVDSDLQLSIYALACKRVLGITPTRLSYYFLSRNCKISTLRTDRQLRDTVDLVVETADQLMRREFAPNFSHCRKCDFKKNCRQFVKGEK
jgi:DNA helicase-2/ATP-dependent DNA helicase PcrA